MILLLMKGVFYMYDLNSYYTPTVTTGYAGSVVWTIVSVLLAIIGGFLVYFLFTNKKEKLNNKFLIWLKDFLNFKNLLLEVILKITYAIFAIFITLTSFNVISTSFVGFLLYLVLGNVFLRIIYESSYWLSIIFAI